MTLLENNSICKDRGGIHYQQLGWNDNTHYTVISLHKAANGSNHSTLINKTLSFVSTWRASSIFHWDSHSRPRQCGANIFTGGETMSVAISCAGTAASYAEVRINSAQEKRAISEIILCAPLHKMTIIHLQEVIGLLINNNESMISLPGAEISGFHKAPKHPPPPPTPHNCSKAGNVRDFSYKVNKFYSKANERKWKPTLCYYYDI